MTLRPLCLESRIVPALALTHFSLPTAASSPSGIVSLGTHANVAATDANVIIDINQNGVVTEYKVPTANSEPFGATLGPSTAPFFWFTERAGNKIAWMDALGTFHEFAVPTANSLPWDITAGPDGNIWFTERAGNAIGRAVILNVGQSVIITEFPLPNANSRPHGITAGPDGNVWFTEEAGRIGRITPLGALTEFGVNGINPSPRDIVTGPDGLLWFTDQGQNQVSAIATDGIRRHELSLTTPNSQPLSITAGPNDIWFTETATSKIGRVPMRRIIDPVEIEYALPAGAAPTGIDFRAGQFWVSEPGTNQVATFTTPAVVVTGAGGGGGPHVTAFDSASDKPLYGFFAYDGGFTGGVRVAASDVNGDQVPDILTGPGPGGGPHVKLFDGTTGTVIQEFFAFDASFSGGVYVALGHRTSTKSPGGSYWEIVVGAGPGGGPNVRVFKALTGEKLGDFYAYDAGFRGGVRVAAGEGINADPPIATGPGPGGGPHVKLMNVDGSTIQSFFAFAANFTGGVYVALDYHLPGLVPTIVTGAGEGGGSHVKLFRGDNLALEREFFAYNPAFNGGVRVAATRATFNTELLTATGPGGGPHIRAFDPDTGKSTHEFFAYDPSFVGGVFVAEA